MRTRDLFRFHPVTGADANDIDTSSMSDSERAELAAMVRAGARFYWLADKTHGHFRIERKNYQFVADMVDERCKWIDSPWTRTQ